MIRAFGSNQASAVVVGLVAVAAFAATYGFDPVPDGLPGLGAVEFPRLVCSLMLGMAGLLFFTESPPPDPEAAPPIDRGAWGVFAACVLALPVMALVGMIGAIAIFMVAAGRIWGETRWPMLAVVSIGLTASVWLVFVKIFRLTLPGGMLFGG